MNAILVILTVLWLHLGNPCAIGQTAEEWHEVLERGVPEVAIFSQDTFPFLVLYGYQGRFYLFVSNDTNEHGRCLVRLGF